MLDQGRSLSDSMGKICYKRYKGTFVLSLDPSFL
jgi:hypothetical protein